MPRPRRGQTLVTAAFFALITGVGGGSVRDLLIGAPVFWVHDPLVAAVCLAACRPGVDHCRRPGGRTRRFDWLDAVGLAAYAVFGAAKALAFGVPPVPAALMGVMTACVGGIIRDVLAGEPSILMRPELYVTAAALAAGLHVALVAIGLPAFAAAVIAAARRLQPARCRDLLETRVAQLSRAALTLRPWGRPADTDRSPACTASDVPRPHHPSTPMTMPEKLFSQVWQRLAGRNHRRGRPAWRWQSARRAVR